VRVLVTGATGFLGAHLVALLEGRGHDVVSFARATGGDVLDAQGVRAAVAGCEAAFHCAGHVSRDPDDAEALYRVHVDGTKNVLEACSRAGVERVVVASTSGTVAVSDTPGRLATEDDEAPLGLVSRWPYYRAKLFAERAALAFNRPGFDVVSVNPSLLLGPVHVARDHSPPSSASGPVHVARAHSSPSSASGPVHGARAHSSPSSASGPVHGARAHSRRWSAAPRRETHGSSTDDVRLFLEGAIPAVPAGGLSFVDVRDAAEAMRLAMDRGKGGERYLVGACNLTMRDFFGKLARVSGVPAPWLPMPRSREVARIGAGLVKRLAAHIGLPSPVDAVSVEMAQCFWYVDASKAERDLGWSARDPGATLHDTVQDLRARGAVWPRDPGEARGAEA
jgi:nucleoside-diphosphate-sugar epimerase